MRDARVIRVSRKIDRRRRAGGEVARDEVGARHVAEGNVMRIGRRVSRGTPADPCVAPPRDRDRARQTERGEQAKN